MIDSHCHLDHDPLLDNLTEVITRSKEIGITKLLTICTTLKSFVIPTSLDLFMTSARFSYRGS